MELDRRICDRARRSRDARFDGKFFIAVTSTKIYCRPICPARSPKDENVRYYPTAAAAQAAGFRPCLRCRPEAAPGTPAWFGSVRRFNGEMRKTYSRTPTELRRLARTPAANAGRYRFRIAYRPPYDWPQVIEFLAARATPGVELVEANRYSRTITINGKNGAIAIAPALEGPALVLDVDLDDSRSLLTIVERVRRMFDVAADPAVIAGQLSGDSLLTRTLSLHPGIRTPGAWDPFELTVRAILGQQISVKAATTIAGRVAARWGTPIETASGLTRLFPTAGQLSEAPLEEAGIIAARASTLRALARAVRDGALTFAAESTLAGLQSIAGIGPWTAQYVAMRALNEPDAFLTGDLVLRRMAGDCSARELDRLADAWRPWRAYAVMLLWQAARDRDEQQRTPHAQTNCHRHIRSRHRSALVSTAAR